MALRDLPEARRLPATDQVRVGLVGLRGRPLRAALSALGIAIGIAAMVSVLGIGTASRQGLLDEIRRLGTNMLTAHPGTNLFGQQATLPTESVSMVTRIPGVRQASSVGQISGASVRRSDRIPASDTGGIAVSAARLDLLATLGGGVRDGTYLTTATEQYPVTVLGDVAAGRLGVTRAGGEVFLGGRLFTVIGILSPEPLAPEIDRSALVGWPAARALLHFDGHPTTVYERSSDSSVSAVSDVLAATVDPQSPSDVRVSRPSDALTAQLAAKSTFNSLLLGLGTVALLVGGIGIANTMVISVLERRQEIGLRRALGASRGQIRLQFFTESVLLAATGGTVGVALGTAVSTVYALSRDWPVPLSPQTTAAAIAIAATVGAVAGLYPAARAARMTPTEALTAQ